MPDSSALVLGADLSGQSIAQSLRLANRHGLVAGATGTGKTVTLQRLAEQFSDAGVAVFAADIKGDLCGLGAAANPQGKIAERIAGMPWLNYQAKAYPVTLWDIQGKTGHPLRTTLSEMGPLLLGSLLELTKGGAQAITLPTGETRTFLQDGDELTIAARAQADGRVSIGFGECRGVIEPAL